MTAAEHRPERPPGPDAERPTEREPEAIQQSDSTGSGINSNNTSVTVWVARIEPHLRGAAEHIVAAGRELIDAKAALPHGGFGPLLTQLGLTPRMAQQFMAIARHAVLSNAQRASYLPPAWTTLFELSRLEPDVIDQMIIDGTVTPSLDRNTARQLGTAQLEDEHRVDDLAELERKLGYGIGTLRSTFDTWTETKHPSVAATGRFAIALTHWVAD
jgi:hypothetical protein